MFVMDCYGHKLSYGVLFAYHLILDVGKQFNKFLMVCGNLYKLPDSLANPANAILSSKEKMNALADVANTKAAAAAQSPMAPPPATPGTSGKKRKRSAATLARDKLASSKSKKYQRTKLHHLANCMCLCA